MPKSALVEIVAAAGGARGDRAEQGGYARGGRRAGGTVQCGPEAAGRCSRGDFNEALLHSYKLR